MQHSQTMGQPAKMILAIAVLGLLGACADGSSVAPTAEVQAITAPANYVKVGNSIVFRVNNSEGTVRKLGAHAIYIPAGAICDLSKSGYGATQWDTPCNPQKGSVTITATVFNGPDGQPYIDFQPAMRFAPTKEVVLFFRQGQVNAPVTMTVQYCDNLGICIDESLNDPSLRPFTVANTAILGRRLKHFSGYAIIAGDECVPPGVVTTDENGNLWCDMGTGMSRKSGYMVASGEDITTVMGSTPDKKDDEK